MSSRRLAAGLGLGLAVVLAAPATDAAPAPSFDVVEAEDGLQITIAFSSSDSEDFIPRLAATLDGMDMTAALRRAGPTRVSLATSVPLATGAHELKLYLISADGSDFDVIATHSFATGTGAGAEDRLRIENLRILANHEIAIRSYDTSYGHMSANSSGNFEGVARYGSWTMSGQVNYLGSSEEAERLTDNGIDIGQYSASLRHDGEVLTTEARLGNQAFSGDTLLVSQLNRRGVSLRATTNDERVSVQAFSARADASIGVENITGVDNPHDRLYGATASYKVLNADEARVTLLATGYKGEGMSYYDTNAGEGSGYAAGVNMAFFDERLGIQAGYARATTDHDGDGSVIDAETGDAINATITYEILRPDYSEGIDSPSLSVGAGYKRVAADYFSFANPFESSDHEDYSANVNFSQGGFFATGQALHQTSNVDDNPYLPTDRILTGGVNLSYSPFMTEPGPEWLGTAQFAVGGQISKTDRLDAPSGYYQPDYSYTTWQAFTAVSTYYRNWGWALTESVTDYVEGTSGLSSHTDYMTDISANWSPSADMSLDANAQWIRSTDPSVKTVDAFVFGIGASYTIIPEELTTAGRYSANLSSDSAAFEGGELTAELNWTLKPGYTVSFRGGTTHGDNVGPTGFHDSDTYGSLVLRISTPYSK